MIAGNAAENLLLVIETQRKGADVLTGIRKELGELGVGAKEAGRAIAVGAEAGIAEIVKLSQTIDVSSKNDVAALRATAQAVREMATAAGVAPAEVQRLAVAEEVLNARVKATTQEIRAQAAVLAGTGTNLNEISPKARTAANAFTMLAYSATGMGGSLQSATVAAGTLVSSLASLSSSAAIAAGASGLGAVVVTLGALIPLLKGGAGHADDFSASLMTIGRVQDATEIDNMIRSIQGEIARQKQGIKDFEKSLGTIQSQAEINRLKDLKATLAAEEEVLKQAKARQYQIALQSSDEQAEIYKKLHTTIIRASQSGRAGPEDRAADKATSQQIHRANAAGNAAMNAVDAALKDKENRSKQAAEEVIKLQEKLDAVLIEGELRRMGKVAEIEDLAINRRYDQMRAEIRALDTSEEEKTRLLSAAEAARTAELEKNAAKRTAVAEDEARKAVEAEKRKAAKRLATVRSSVDAIVRTEGSVLQTLKRIALEPIVSELEGIAAKEAVKALASFPNAAAMAAHGAAAAAATLAAHEVASWAGGSSKSSSSRGGSGGGVGSSEPSFEPRTSATGAGALNLTLITRNPYGRDEIQNVAYELNRSGILKRPPIQIPPTNGIVRIG